MERKEYAKKTIDEIFNDVLLFNEDSQLQEIYQNFVFGDLYQFGNLDNKKRELVTLVSLVTLGTFEMFQCHVEGALNTQLKPKEIKEAIYQCCPYVGFSKVASALKIVNNVFKTKGITVVEKNTDIKKDRFNQGINCQSIIFGKETIQANHNNALPELKHIQTYLSEFCFGDFYTREGLDLQTRELLTFVMIATLGGCENQLRAHVRGNLNVGNSRDTLIKTITQCIPYIGFPRVLNTINVINEITLNRGD